MTRPDIARMAQDFETLQGKAADRACTERRLRAARIFAAAAGLLALLAFAAWALHVAAVVAHTITDPLGGVPW